MPANANMKLKLLYVLKILVEKSGEEYPLTVNDIIGELKAYKISAERKSIYTDIELLKEFGIEVKCIKGRAYKYYVDKLDYSKIVKHIKEA